MTNKKIIIHLSDLHVTNILDDDGNRVEKIGSWLTTDYKDPVIKNYCDEFCRCIEENYPGAEKFLFISGDLADSGSQAEFDATYVILERIVTRLKISKDAILIVPGDHDVNRLSLQMTTQQDLSGKKSYEFDEEKFVKFSPFYKKFLNNDFQAKSAVVAFLEFETEKLIFVGLNSNFHIGYKGGKGFIDHDRLDSELEQLLTNFPKHSRICVFHHNLSGQYENNLDGQWEENNKREIMQVLEKHNIKVIMFGNEHTSASNSENQMVEISVGSFGKKNSLAGFKIYEIESEGSSLSLEHKRYSLINDSAHKSFPFGYWSRTDLNKQNENIEKIVLRHPAENKIIESEELVLIEATGTNSGDKDQTNVEAVSIEKTEKTASEPKSKPRFEITENEYHEKLFKIIKEGDLFKSGHFHWNDSSKAHNWIDVPMLLSKRANILLAQKAILNIVQKNDLKFDFVLGLGIEGNIIANYTALRTDTPYSYLPYSYRYHDHEKYEKEISIKNDGKFKDILIITDVVNNGKTVGRLLENEKDFFDQGSINSIAVVSLFYTGDIHQQSGSESIDDKINHYFVSHMKVERCPYGKDFRQTCMIYREKLACVHEFYDAAAAIKNITDPNTKTEEVA